MRWEWMRVKNKGGKEEKRAPSVIGCVGGHRAPSIGHAFVTHTWHLLLYPATRGLVRGN